MPGLMLQQVTPRRCFNVEHIRGLRFGPLGATATHICVDMQMIFADDTPWASGAVRSVLPAIREICKVKTGLSIFTRFLCPRDRQALRGQWQRFYSDCPQMLEADPRLFDIVPELRPFVPEDHVVNRFVFSVFEDGNLQSLLAERGIDTLVFSGVETDVCVLASILRAIDTGYRVIVAEDAVASSNAQGHEAALRGIFPRFDQQVELADIGEILEAWR